MGEHTTWIDYLPSWRHFEHNVGKLLQRETATDLFPTHFTLNHVFFALVAFDTLYLKADAPSQALFEAAGSQPFRYTYKDGRTVTMGYWTAPEDTLESPAAMEPWARGALACALRARKAHGKRA